MRPRSKPSPQHSPPKRAGAKDGLSGQHQGSWASDVGRFLRALK